MAVKRIPAGFYDDHCERDLDAPPAVKRNKTAVWIDTDDPAFGELLSDAKWYASLKPEGDWDRRPIMMARSLIRSLTDMGVGK